MNKVMWKDLFKDYILERGIDYFNRNFIENVYVKDNIIKSTVCGTKEYKVEIVTDNEAIIDLSCNCPYADSGENCKHMAAVLSYLESKENALAGQDRGESIGKLVEAVDTSIVKEFLIDVLRNDYKLLNRFKSKLKSDISPTDMAGYKNQISNVFRKYAGRHGFIDYRNATYFISELQETLDTDIQSMVNNNQLQEAFELTNYIFIRVGNQDMDDSDGGTGEIADICLDIWQEILYKCEIKLKGEMFNWFITHLNGSVIDYMEAYIEQIIFDDFKEEEFVTNKSVFLDNKIIEYKKETNVWSNSYRLGQLVLRRIEILEERDVNPNIIEAYCKENLEINEIRKYYIDLCINRKDYDMAIKLLKEGRDKAKDSPGLIISYSLTLKDLYKQIGKNKLYEEELWALVLNYKASDLDLYKELKSIYSDEEWMKEREKVFSKLASNRGIDKFYELEGLYDRLLELVVRSHGLYMVTEYEKVLKDIYPKEILSKYENIVKTMATNTSSRAHYKEIVSILRRMNKYPDGKLKVSEIVSEWKTRHRNRPAMMDELNKI